MQQTTTLGAEFAAALAAKDYARLHELMHPEIDFRALTPNRFWQEGEAQAVIAQVLRDWFADKDEIDALEHVESDAFADCERVGYRLRVHNPDGRFLVEQQAYLTERDGRIGWMRVVCSGYRPVDS